MEARDRREATHYGLVWEAGGIEAEQALNGDSVALDLTLRMADRNNSLQWTQIHADNQRVGLIAQFTHRVGFQFPISILTSIFIFINLRFYFPLEVNEHDRRVSLLKRPRRSGKLIAVLFPCSLQKDHALFPSALGLAILGGRGAVSGLMRSI